MQQDVKIIHILERDNCRQFKKIIRSVLNFLVLFQMGGLVHCDLKSENILIELDYRRKIVKSVKVIDFGSSLPFDIVNDSVELTTPEYLPPEILDFIEFKNMNAVGAAYNDQIKQQLNIQKRLW